MSCSRNLYRNQKGIIHFFLGEFDDGDMIVSGLEQILKIEVFAPVCIAKWSKEEQEKSCIKQHDKFEEAQVIKNI